MKLREIVLFGSMLISGIAFSQEKMHFDIYNKGEGVFSPRLNMSSIKVDANEVDFSFLFGIYSMKLRKMNDSTYQEIVKDNLILGSKEELFTYSLKNSSYTLNDYFVVSGEPRKEKEALEGTTFGKKYKTLLEIFDDLQKGLLKDSAHFFVFGMPYSVGIKKSEENGFTIYSCNLNGTIKEEPGDFIIFPYPAEIISKKKEGKIIPLKFFTKSLNVRNKRVNSIEGILQKD
jgi:hypothetical protein